MNIPELLISLHINTLHSLRLIAKKNKLSIQQVLCIYSIPLDGITQTNLADSLSIDVSTLSRNLNKLEEQSINIRECLQSDERFFKIFLTTYGKDLFQSILNDLTSYIKTLKLSTASNDMQNIVDSLLNLNWHILKDKTNNVYSS